MAASNEFPRSRGNESLVFKSGHQRAGTGADFDLTRTGVSAPPQKKSDDTGIRAETEKQGGSLTDPSFRRRWTRATARPGRGPSISLFWTFKGGSFSGAH